MILGTKATGISTLAALVSLASYATARADDPELSYPPERGRTAIAQAYYALFDSCDRVVSPKTIFDRLSTELDPKRARIDARAGIVPKFSGDRGRDLLALQRYPERSTRLLRPSDRDAQPQLTFAIVMDAIKDASDDCVSYDYDDTEGSLDAAIGFRYTDIGYATTTDPGLRETRVLEVVPHSSAARDGIAPGDLVVSQDSDPERRDAPVRVTFEHDGTRHVVTLKPERLFHQTVFSRSATARVGVLRLTGIGPNTTSEFSEARAASLASGHTGLVVDLRDVRNADASSARALATVLVRSGVTSTMQFRGAQVTFATGGVTDAVSTAILAGDETDAAALLLADAAHRGGAKIVGSASNPFTDVIAYSRLASTTIMRVRVGIASHEDVSLKSDASAAAPLDPTLGLSTSDANDAALRTAITLLSGPQ